MKRSLIVTSATMALAGATVLGLLVHQATARAGGKEGPPPPPRLDVQPIEIFGGGTQPLSGGIDDLGENVNLEPILEAGNCAGCHANYGDQDPFLMVEPYKPWVASLMGQAARDPVFHAGLEIAKDDLGEDGAQFCVRCHVPNAFLEGRTPTSAAEFTDIDLEGITCNFCHRMVDPVYKSGISPPEDEVILTQLDDAGWLPPASNNARYVFDPSETRRGPFPYCDTPGDCGPEDVPLNPHPTPTIGSPFHSESEFCWTCHGVSNPLMVRQPDDTYTLNTPGTAHPTGHELDMMPLHRTFQEWENSYYPDPGVDHVGRFGGTNTEPMKSCQDCHMPDTQGFGCTFNFPPFFERMNVPQHSFMGSNTWVVGAVRDLYPDSETGLSAQIVADQKTRTQDFLTKASDLTLLQLGNQLRTRVINHTGHKLPTGFPDGRQVWVNVKFFNCHDELIREHGHYDFTTAELTRDTKVYEMIMGLDAAMAAATGLPEGPTLHFQLANVILKDNRIPPTGWFHSLAEVNQTLPVGATYANGQHWDDTMFDIPAGSERAVVTVYHQVTSREFIEFLRDAAVDQSPTSPGNIAYDLWVAHGMSTPEVMDMMEIPVSAPLFGDLNDDGLINVADLLALLAVWGTCEDCVEDLDGDGMVATSDLLLLLAEFGGTCP